MCRRAAALDDAQSSAAFSPSSTLTVKERQRVRARVLNASIAVGTPQQDVNGKFLCFFAGCHAAMRTNFARHLLRYRVPR